MSEKSTKPYFLRALHEWCTDQGYTPYISVSVDEKTIVPRAFVKGGEIVLNVSSMATHGLTIGNEFIEFQGRFGGVAYDLSIPVGNVAAIYARETGHGMAFDVSRQLALPIENSGLAETTAESSTPEDQETPTPTATPKTAQITPLLRSISRGEVNGQSRTEEGTDDSPDGSPKGPRPFLKRIK